MDLSASDYYAEFLALLPPGPAWSVEDSANAAALIAGLTQEFARVKAAADGLAGEADPRTTFLLLADFQRIFGLPTACMANISQSLAQQRQALVAQMNNTGGQSPAYFIALAAAAGFTITIKEFFTATVLSTVNAPLNGAAWAYAWQVNASLTSPVTDATVASAVSDPLRSWGNALLECLINRYKPAHTSVYFNYT